MKQIRAILRIKDATPDEMFELCEAIWMHNGNPDMPHALLTDGLTCSTGYIKTSNVTQFGNLKSLLVAKQLQSLLDIGIAPGDFDLAISSSMVALTLGDEFGRQANAVFAFTEKRAGQEWTGRFEYPPGIRVIQVEELITKTKTVKAVHENFAAANPEAEFVTVGGRTVVSAVVWRPQDTSVTDTAYRLVPLMTREIKSSPIKDCSHCKLIAPRSPKTCWTSVFLPKSNQLK